jgi:hypothetical protein
VRSVTDCFLSAARGYIVRYDISAFQNFHITLFPQRLVHKLGPITVYPRLYLTPMENQSVSGVTIDSDVDTLHDESELLRYWDADISVRTLFLARVLIQLAKNP